MAYATEALILAVIQQLNSSISSVSTGLWALATADVNASLLQADIDLPQTDLHSMLEKAEICFYLEHAGMSGAIQNTLGVVSMEQYGKVTKKYENGMPMFFFAQGSSTPFLELLPHETFRMRGYKYVRSFIRAYYRTVKATNATCYIQVGTDTTIRGHDWDLLPEDAETDFVEEY